MKKITTLMIALLAGFGSWAQCDATFYSWQNQNSAEMNLYATDSSQTVTYSWNMGDGTIITTINGMANYTYNAPGTYYACLTVDDGIGCTDTFCDTIVVNSIGTPPPPPPTCSADYYWWQAYDSITNTYSSDVYLVNMATGSNLTYNWNFGDGTTSTLQYPTHTYAQVGSYVICLTVDNGNGCTDTFCDTISIVVKAAGFTVNVISESQAGALSIEDEAVIDFSSMYPNPVNVSATLELNAIRNMNISATVYDVSGKQISSEQYSIVSGNNKIILNTSTFTNGLYLLNLQSEDGSFTKTIRFAKQ